MSNQTPQFFSVRKAEFFDQDMESMGDLQDPTDGGTLVPYFWPYFVGIFPEI